MHVCGYNSVRALRYFRRRLAMLTLCAMRLIWRQLVSATLHVSAHAFEAVVPLCARVYGCHMLGFLEPNVNPSYCPASPYATALDA